MKIVAAMVAVCAFAGIAIAGEAVGPKPPAKGQRQALARPVTTFGYLDIDKDRRLSLQEARVDWAVAEGFNAADVNRDGFLDMEEFKLVGRG